MAFFTISPSLPIFFAQIVFLPPNLLFSLVKMKSKLPCRCRIYPTYSPHTLHWLLLLYMGEARTKNKEQHLSKYEKVSMGSKTKKFLLFLCYDWLARVLGIGHLVRIFRAKLVCNKLIRCWFQNTWWMCKVEASITNKTREFAFVWRGVIVVNSFFLQGETNSKDILSWFG